MNFHDIYKKIAELDQPKAPVNEECGSMPPSMGSTPTTPPPSVSINLNAQGMDNIESLFKLMTKVNPDMMPKTAEPMPSMSDPVMKLAMAKRPGDDVELEDGFDTATTAPDPEYKDISAAIPNGNDIHKPKRAFQATAGADNPMNVGENSDLVSSIKTQLLAQLAEHKKQ